MSRRSVNRKRLATLVVLLAGPAMLSPAVLGPASASGAVAETAWPGGSAVRAADAEFGAGDSNVSGLAYESSGTSAPGRLWVVQNSPSKLYTLSYDTSTREWGASPGVEQDGRDLHYPDGQGHPDAEGVTLVGGSAADGVYVSTERDNAVPATSRLSVLHYSPTAGVSDLSADAEWNLTSQLPAVAPNSGLESVAWVPDSYLSFKGFVDATTGSAYDPSDYGPHDGGVFFVALEGTGNLYGFVLEQDGTATKVAKLVPSGLAGVMDLSWEPEKNRLWAVCDNTCAGRAVTLNVSTTTGNLAVKARFKRPSGMPNVNNEGFATAPQAECSPTKRTKHVLWAEDYSSGSGPALRQGTLSCTPSSS